MTRILRHAIRRISRRPSFAAMVVLTLGLGIGATVAVFSLVNGVLLTPLPFEAPDRLLAADVSFTGGGYETLAEQSAFVDRFIERVESLPGVETATATTFAPLSATGSATSFWANDRPIPEAGQAPVADIRPVHRDYHQAMGIPIVRGRGFDERDGPGSPLRVVVNQVIAERLWPDVDPVGRTISMPWNDTLVAEVIGVAGDVRINGPSVPPRPLLYWHRAQWEPFGMLTVMARTTGEPTRVAPALRSLARELDPGLPLFDVRAVASDLGAVVGRTRFAMSVLTAFAALALLLAAIGIYGVISYSVGQRSHEFGVRMTLGATRFDVARQVLKHGTILVGLSLAVGGVAALAGTRLLQGLLFGVDPTDVLTFSATASVLAGVALLAAWIPARRAAATDPMRALRS